MKKFIATLSFSLLAAVALSATPVNVSVTVDNIALAQLVVFNGQPLFYTAATVTIGNQQFQAMDLWSQNQSENRQQFNGVITDPSPGMAAYEAFLSHVTGGDSSDVFSVVNLLNAPYSDVFLVRNYTPPAATPEPASMALVGIGLLTAGLASRKRFAKEGTL